ncbi:leucine-rich repeat-containing protein 17-like [Callorhinchus milii]|uniref:leucine-rich repeat-containing protein 17-like n=1 Tax=Callorhinchus milii TaxID=7868 RepID=UPI001C3F649D|nr:leucine-rich repeat-containing protein 17-like [Callorhinchus milii]
MLLALLVCPLVALVSSLQVGVLKVCPHRCSCHDFSHFVDCKGRALSLVPGRIPYGTWMLDLRSNNLTEIPAASFSGLWSLRIILLSCNQLELLHVGAFEGLGFLERLDLNRNRLKHLPEDFSNGLHMRYLEKLEKLDLSGNQIGSMEKGVFRGLTKLRNLLLKDNSLTVIENGFFFMLQSLEALHLERNNISSIQLEAFASLRSLSLLGLNGNRLSHLTFKIFLNIQTQGTHLQLADNQWICDCDLQRVFGKVLSVRHLHVDDYSNITCSDPGSLAGSLLVAVDSQLCMAETATVLVITATVLVTVIAAVVMAERNRKKNGNQERSESDSPFDSQEK